MTAPSSNKGEQPRSGTTVDQFHPGMKVNWNTFGSGYMLPVCAAAIVTKVLRKKVRITLLRRGMYRGWFQETRDVYPSSLTFPRTNEVHGLDDSLQT